MRAFAPNGRTIERTMAEHIPFITGEDACTLVGKLYSDSEVVRLPLERATRLGAIAPKAKKWLDPGVDGMADVGTRRTEPGRANSWFDFMSTFPYFEEIGAAGFHERPVTAKVNAFVVAVMDKCAEHGPAWITVPQLPLVDGSERNKINRALATATGKWKSSSKYSGRLILPLILTNQRQSNGKTERNPKVALADRCYHEAQADGVWIVDKSLSDDNGSPTLRNRRFPGLLALHEEIAERIASKIRIAGPYWGLNLVLWAKGLVEFPAIGVGSGYQYYLAGGHARPPSAKIALPSLRRRVGVGRLAPWLHAAIQQLDGLHPFRAELGDIRKRLTTLSEPAHAREQVATFYKRWFDLIASAPTTGRSMALFQDLSAAYALGKGLRDLEEDGTARRPEAVVEPLMLSCL
jgi:hypothetical protein